MASQEIDKLIKIFAKLPGLGTRSARRIVLNLLKNNDTTLKNLIVGLTNVQEQIKVCPICGNFDTTVPCSICVNEKKDASVVCVVQDVADLWAMDRVSQFKGKYHVLQGLISPIDGIGAEDIRIKELLQRIAQNDVKEVIIALNPSVEGEATSLYLTKLIKPFNIKVSRIAFGLPIGSDIEYADEITLAKAIECRREID